MCSRQPIQLLFSPQKCVSGFQASKLDKNQTHCSANTIYRQETPYIFDIRYKAMVLKALLISKTASSQQSALTPPSHHQQLSSGSGPKPLSPLLSSGFTQVKSQLTSGHVSVVHPSTWEEQLSMSSNNSSQQMHKACTVWLSLTWCSKPVSYVNYYIFPSRSTVLLQDLLFGYVCILCNTAGTSNWVMASRPTVRISDYNP